MSYTFSDFKAWVKQAMDLSVKLGKFTKLQLFSQSRALWLWWRNWKVKKLTSHSLYLKTFSLLFLSIVQYYLYGRKDDGDKIFVCNHTWFFLSFKCLAFHFFSFHFYGTRAIKPLNSSTTATWCSTNYYWTTGNDSKF